MAIDLNIDAVPEIANEAHALVMLITVYRPRLTAIERHIIDHLAIVSEEGQKCLTVVRGIMNALETRLDVISRSLALGTPESLDSAKQVLRSPIVLDDDIYQRLVTDGGIPPIPPRELKKALEAFISKIQVRRRPRYASF